MNVLLPRCVPALSLVMLLYAGEGRADDGVYEFRDAQRFLGQFCVECHGPVKPRGGLNLKRFEKPEQVVADRKVWDEIVARMRGGEMPPPDAKQPAPPDEARRAFLRWAQQAVRAGLCDDDSPRTGPAPIRRLNKSQYRATIRDLLGIHFDASHALPDDGAGGEGFDNAAETLFISPVHAEKYLEAAKEALRYAASDSAARARIFIAAPDDKTTAEEAARRVLERFVLRAYRRPARAGEVDRLMALFKKEQARGQPFDDAVLYALQAALVSPHFLFRVEGPATTRESGRVSDYELATRLSYFLWNSMPDDRLFELAAAGKLQDEETLKGEMRRLLKDRKARGLAESFAGQWLETRRLGTEVKPDRQVFPRYTDELESAMREEPILFLLEILAENRSLVELLDADFTYADQALARHYGIPPPPGFGQPRRVSLPKDSHRGGVLTMAAVLTVSSYPHRTSPVLRGKWVMESLLGTPPKPPPPDVPSLPEDKKQAEGKTLRERLLAHRANPACASCHDRIDPLGFGLEHFDAVGHWRDKDAGQPVDATGSLPDGTRFDGPDALKKALLERKDDFMRHLAAKMLGYALGRGLVSEDYCVVDKAVESLKQNDYRSHALLWEIINSAPFRYRPGGTKKGTAP
jgi:hypothetical protein